jgi:hypothetical protein
MEAAVSAIRECWHRLLAEAALFDSAPWTQTMSEYLRYRSRQHAPADVAPELYDAEDEDR